METLSHNRVTYITHSEITNVILKHSGHDSEYYRYNHGYI